MAKKPDLSEFSKKFDLNNIVGSIKSLINPTAGTPEVDPNDAIGVKIAQLSVMVQQLSKTTEEQSKEYNRMNQLLNGLFQDLERLRNPVAVPATEVKTETTTTASPAVNVDTSSIKAQTTPPPIHDQQVTGEINTETLKPDEEDKKL